MVTPVVLEPDQVPVPVKTRFAVPVRENVDNVRLLLTLNFSAVVKLNTVAPVKVKIRA
jgi:hypothetical protein